MQMAIDGIVAEVSSDGHDIQLPAPALAGRALTLPFPGAPQAARPRSGAPLVAATAEPGWHAPSFGLDASATAVLILCAAVAAVAAKRFVARAGIGRIELPSRLDEVLDDAAFLKRYGRTL